MRERTMAGMRAARALGRKGGRPKKLDENQAALAVRLYNERNHTINEICQMIGISDLNMITISDDGAPLENFTLRITWPKLSCR